MSLLNIESYVFINVFYLALFCIHVCVDDVIYIYITNSQIEFKTSMLNSSLCDYSDAYILFHFFKEL